MAEAAWPKHPEDPHSVAQTQGSKTALDLCTRTPQISAVAPWFDIPNSYQRYRMRVRLRTPPKYISKYPPRLFLAPGTPDLIPSSDDMQSTTTGPAPVGQLALRL